jgi:uncharacterized lipoprotein YmbA
MSRVALLVAVALLQSGCARPFQRPPLQKTSFVIRLAAPAPGVKTAGALSVDRVRVSSLFDRSGFVYRTGEDTFASDAHFEWFGPPGAVLREAIVDWLDDASPFAAVQRGSLSGASWLLETDVDRFYADRRDASASAVVLTGRFELLDLRGPLPRRVLSQRFDERELAGAGTPQELVDAWGRALARALSTLEPQLRKRAERARSEPKARGVPEDVSASATR